MSCFISNDNIFKNEQNALIKIQKKKQITKGTSYILCLGFRASYVNIYKENQLDAV